MGRERAFAGTTRSLDGLSEGTALTLGEKEGTAAASSSLSSVPPGLLRRHLSVLPFHSLNRFLPSLPPVAPPPTLSLWRPLPLHYSRESQSLPGKAVQRPIQLSRSHPTCPRLMRAPLDGYLGSPNALVPVPRTRRCVGT